MNVILGVVDFLKRPIDRDGFSRLPHATRRWTGVETRSRLWGHIAMCFQPRMSHANPSREPQGIWYTGSNHLLFDGRLDNRTELQHRLQLSSSNPDDGQIVLAAFQKWGSSAFSKLVGDWALSLWSAGEDALYLARDHAGTRTLYFQFKDRCARWSTYIDTWDGFPGTVKQLEPTYAASYLIGRPDLGTTPIKGIHAVLPGHVVRIDHDGFRQYAHWVPFVPHRLRYKSEAEYDEHFLQVLERAVERRAPPEEPILAHLSGGVDSSSIVCISDRMRRRSNTHPDLLLDTVSFCDDGEPSWNEKPYFQAVAAARGKATLLFDVSQAGHTFLPAPVPEGTFLLPGYDSGSFAHEVRFHEAIGTRGYRAILSGLGGDELFGGVPSPLPELSDLLASGRFFRLLKRGLLWAKTLRRPITYLLHDTTKFAFNAYFVPSRRSNTPPWITRKLQQESKEGSLQDARNRLSLRTPSSLVSARSWWNLLLTLPNPHNCALERIEHRFPFLDREVVEFALSLPNEQLVQPGRRRYMMRRALTGIVPSTVLERRRKAYIERAPALLLTNSYERMRALVRSSPLVEFGYVDREAFEQALEDAAIRGRAEWRTALMKTCLFDLWLHTGAVSL